MSTVGAVVLALQAATEPTPISSGDTAWLLMSTAMVLLMTPALGFFYGGLVRSKNILNTLMMSFASLGVVGVTWSLLGYSLAFSEGNAFIGGSATRCSRTRGATCRRIWPRPCSPSAARQVPSRLWYNGSASFRPIRRSTRGSGFLIGEQTAWMMRDPRRRRTSET